MTEWNTFTKSYNAFLVPTTALGDFKAISAYDFGYRFSYNKIFSSLIYEHYHGRATANFAANESRQFDAYANAVSWAFGLYLIKPSARFTVAPFFTIRFGDRTRLVSENIYADGFHSRGSDKSLNGTYSGQGLLGEELGLLVKLKLSKLIHLEVELNKMWANSLQPSTLDDKSNYKAFRTGGVGSQLPQDYAAYDKDPLQYTLDNGLVVHDKMSSTRIVIGVSFLISNYKNSTWWQ